MSAERMSQSNTPLAAWPLTWLTRCVVRFPGTIVALALVAAVLSLVLTVTRLGFHTSRAELLNPQSDYNQRWIKYTEEFGDKEDVVVVVEGASREVIVPVLDELYAAISAQRGLFDTVLHEIDLSKIREKGLHYLKPSELVSIERFLDNVEPMLRGDWSPLSLGSIAAYLGTAMQPGRGGLPQETLAVVQSEMVRLADGLTAALGPSGRYRSPWPEMFTPRSAPTELASGHLLSGDDRLGFVLLRLVKEDKESFAQNSEAIDTLHRLIAQVRARHPETKVGLTGLPVIENDEMRCSHLSMTLASVLSFTGVLAVMIVAFGAFRHSLMAMGALMLGMTWSCGCITLTVGHVNILSIAFGSILFGLGIDYGVYYVARYLQLRETSRSTSEAIVETARTVGPGITTGALTSAIAFFATGLTEFSGVAQLGVIAGGGILLCWVAQMTVLPAMIQLADAHGPRRKMPAPLNLNLWLRPLFGRPRLVLAATLAGTLVVAGGMRYLWYDYNLLHLQPVGLESVELEHKLFYQTNRSAWFALSIADSPEAVLARKAQFLALPSVERVEEIASLFPAEEAQKRPVIQRVQQRLANLPQCPPQIPVTPPTELDRALCGTQSLLAAAPTGTQAAARLQQLRELIGRTPPAEYFRRVFEYQQNMANDLLMRLQALRAVANPEPPGLSDLPEGLVPRYVGKHGRFLQKIYAKINIWDMEGMKQFVEQVRSVDPQVTGNPLQVYEASRQMKRSYEQAAWYALLAIVPVVLLDYRRLRHTLLAILPMGVGMVQTFGLLGLLDIALNPANMIVLPLILGIGVESGVNIVHDFRNQGRSYRQTSNSTIVAVVVNSLTTMVGFGALMIANHQGLQSLGRVLTIAMGCCLFSSLILPNLLVRWGPAAQADPTRHADLERPTADELQLPQSVAHPRRYAA